MELVFKIYVREMHQLIHKLMEIRAYDEVGTIQQHHEYVHMYVRPDIIIVVEVV
jgi:hypothetical protein